MSREAATALLVILAVLCSILIGMALGVVLFHVNPPVSACSGPRSAMLATTLIDVRASDLGGFQ